MKLLHITISLISICQLCFGQHLDWAQAYPRESSVILNGITHDNDGNIFLNGSFGSTMDFDNSDEDFLITSYGASDVYISKQDSAGNFMWAQRFGSDKVDRAVSIEINSAGEIVVLCYFTGVSEVILGPDTFSLPGNGQYLFVLKLSLDGEFIWARQIGRNGSSTSGIDLALDTTGNIYVTGRFSGRGDFDPGVDSFFLQPQGNGDMFVLKLNTAGNFRWAKQIRGNSAENPNAIAVDRDQNVYTTGWFRGRVDFDPGPDSTIYIDVADDMFLSKLDSNGNFVWTKVLTGESRQVGLKILITPANFITVFGFFSGTVDFDPGPEDYFITENYQSGFYYDLDESGNFIRAAKLFPFYLISLAVATDRFGNYYIASATSEKVDFDISDEEYIVDPPDTVAGFIAKYNAAWEITWVALFNATVGMTINSIDIDESDNIYSAGRFSGMIDLDPDYNTYLINGTNSDSYLIKLLQDSCGLTVFLDSALQINCNGPGLIASHATAGLEPYLYQWNTNPPTHDSIIEIDSGGIYHLKVSDAHGCLRNAYVLMTDAPNYTQADLNVNMSSTPYRAGFISDIQLDGMNDGCIPVDGQLKLQLDDQMEFISAHPLPDIIEGDTLIWNFLQLTFDSGYMAPKVNVRINSSANFGDTICVGLRIDPVTNDAEPTNNVKTYCSVVSASYDPNDKSAFPAGACEEKFVRIDQPITYTTRFQNVGNSEAINIFILDTVDNWLDISSINIIGHSHPFVIEVIDSTILKFIFQDIHLPDSTTSQEESNGHISYEISPYLNTKDGSQIFSSSSIYFDFNIPVRTNTILHTLVSNVPNCITSLEEDNRLLSGFSVFPNPASEKLSIDFHQKLKGKTTLSLYSTMGQLHIHKAHDIHSDIDELNLDIEGLLPGVYYLQIHAENRIGMYRVAIQ